MASLFHSNPNRRQLSLPAVVVWDYRLFFHKVPANDGKKDEIEEHGDLFPAMFGFHAAGVRTYLIFPKNESKLSHRVQASFTIPQFCHFAPVKSQVDMHRFLASTRALKAFLRKDFHARLGTRQSDIMPVSTIQFVDEHLVASVERVHSFLDIVVAEQMRGATMND